MKVPMVGEIEQVCASGGKVLEEHGIIQDQKQYIRNISKLVMRTSSYLCTLSVIIAPLPPRHIQRSLELLIRCIYAPRIALLACATALTSLIISAQS